MAVAAVVAGFIAIGLAVVFVAYSGGPSQARRNYLSSGRAFRVLIPLLYVALGIAVPALVIAARPAAKGATGALAQEEPNARFKQGQMLFRTNCATCHSLAAANARGVTGPNLDQIGQVTDSRVLSAIRIGGTGDRRMPAGLLGGTDAANVAYYVARVAGR